MPITLIEATAAVDFPADTRRTEESAGGRPTDHRFFSGPVVTAVSLSEPGVAPMSLVGEIETVYSGRASYVRSTLREVDVHGADAAIEFDMEWKSDEGDEIRSLIRIAVGPQFGVIVHATCPAVLMDSYGATLATIFQAAPRR